MPRGQTHPPHIRAHAIADLLSGDPIAVVSERYEVPEQTVKRWRTDIRRQDVLGEPAKKAALGELVSDFLTESLTTLAAQARFARDETWLRQQSADQLGIFFGILADKTVRVLAAIEPGPESTEHVIAVMAAPDVPSLSDG